EGLAAALPADRSGAGQRDGERLATAPRTAYVGRMVGGRPSAVLAVVGGLGRGQRGRRRCDAGGLAPRRWPLRDDPAGLGLSRHAPDLRSVLYQRSAGRNADVLLYARYAPLR